MPAALQGSQSSDLRPWTILYEDDDILAVDKPEGMPAIPGGTPGESLREKVEAAKGRVLVVHRLDKDVSGVVLFAKSAAAHQMLNRQSMDRQVQKDYLALVRGAVQSERGRIDRPLREFGSGRVSVDRRGKPSLTLYEVRERLEGFTLLSVHPQTGRRHQIRAHLYAVGHPVAGDRMYGARGLEPHVPRLMLHACELRLTRPGGGELRVTSPVPESFMRALSSLRDPAAQGDGD